MARSVYIQYLKGVPEGEKRVHYHDTESSYWIIKPEEMYSANNNPDNGKYYIDIDGSFNLETVYEAPIITTKAHYFEFDMRSAMTPLIYNRKNELIPPVTRNDDTWFEIEMQTGIVLYSQQPFLTSYEFNSSSPTTLFRFHQPQILPY